MMVAAGTLQRHSFFSFTEFHMPPALTTKWWDEITKTHALLVAVGSLAVTIASAGFFVGVFFTRNEAAVSGLRQDIATQYEKLSTFDQLEKEKIAKVEARLDMHDERWRAVSIEAGRVQVLLQQVGAQIDRVEKKLDSHELSFRNQPNNGPHRGSGKE